MAVVRHGSRGCAVVLKTGDVVEADAVIVTLPLGVLKVPPSPGAAVTEDI